MPVFIFGFILEFNFFCFFDQLQLISLKVNTINGLLSQQRCIIKLIKKQFFLLKNFFFHSRLKIMSLKQTIETEYKNALKSKIKQKYQLMELILSSIKDLEISNRSGPNKKGNR